MHRRRRSALLLAAILAVATAGAEAQEIERVGDWLLREVMPEADRFDPVEGDPPVRRAYRGDELIGYVFTTSDAPPEEVGYSGPIRVLAGVTTEGVLTGARVMAYRESGRFEWGDFLDEPSLVEQFAGKRVSDAFGVDRDVAGITGATISVRALARGLRNAARRVVITHSPPPEQPPEALTEAELVTLSWYEMQRRHVAATMAVRQRRREPLEVSLIYVSSEELARHLLGERYEYMLGEIDEAGGADEVVLYVVGGGGFVASLRRGWSIEQGGTTIEIPRERVLNIGRPEGALRGQSSQVGALLLDDGEVDVAAPLTFVFDRGRPELGTFRVDYMSRAGLVRMAEAEPAVEAQPIPEAERAPGADAVADPEAEILVGVDAAPTDGAPEEGADAANDAAEESSVVAATPATSSVAPRAARQLGDPDLSSTGQDEAPRVGGGGAARTRVLRTALVILLAWAAFLTKNAALRWASLAATMLILGWIDGGFLSISHVTGLVWVGLSAIGSDPALLVMVVFTVATVLLWGRVFCGFLCPFGALQDLIDRVVPRRFKRELPPRVHRAAWKAKYAILAIIVGAAVMGAQVSLYQYFEPFGTVFFLSSNALLWTIAGAFLIASAVVPRFYCRYVCPLGGLLAIGSLLSLRRIPRVEQCDHCRVCEQQCPTGAIDGPAVSFSECVRCNVCEVQLRERRGVCRHDMEDVRPRLVQIRRAQGVAREPVIGSR